MPKRDNKNTSDKNQEKPKKELTTTTILYPSNKFMNGKRKNVKELNEEVKKREKPQNDPNSIPMYNKEKVNNLVRYQTFTIDDYSEITNTKQTAGETKKNTFKCKNERDYEKYYNMYDETLSKKLKDAGFTRMIYSDEKEIAENRIKMATMMAYCHYKGINGFKEDKKKANKYAEEAKNTTKYFNGASAGEVYSEEAKKIYKNNINIIERESFINNQNDFIENFKDTNDKVIGYYNLAFSYEHGIVVERNIEKAKEFYKEAINIVANRDKTAQDGAYCKACNNLAAILYSQKDVAGAVNYFEEAIKYGNEIAKWNLDYIKEIIEKLDNKPVPEFEKEVEIKPLDQIDDGKKDENDNDNIDNNDNDNNDDKDSDNNDDDDNDDDNKEEEIQEEKPELKEIEKQVNIKNKLNISSIVIKETEESEKPTLKISDGNLEIQNISELTNNSFNITNNNNLSISSATTLFNQQQIQRLDTETQGNENNLDSNFVSFNGSNIDIQPIEKNKLETTVNSETFEQLPNNINLDLSPVGTLINKGENKPSLNIVKNNENNITNIEPQKKAKLLIPEDNKNTILYEFNNKPEFEICNEDINNINIPLEEQNNKKKDLEISEENKNFFEKTKQNTQQNLDFSNGNSEIFIKPEKAKLLIPDNDGIVINIYNNQPELQFNNNDDNNINIPPEQKNNKKKSLEIQEEIENFFEKTKQNTQQQLAFSNDNSKISIEPQKKPELMEEGTQVKNNTFVIEKSKGEDNINIEPKDKKLGLFSNKESDNINILAEEKNDKKEKLEINQPVLIDIVNDSYLDEFKKQINSLNKENEEITKKRKELQSKLVEIIAQQTQIIITQLNNNNREKNEAFAEDLLEKLEQNKTEIEEQEQKIEDINAKLIELEKKFLYKIRIIEEKFEEQNDNYYLKLKNEEEEIEKLKRKFEKSKISIEQQIEQNNLIKKERDEIEKLIRSTLELIKRSDTKDSILTEEEENGEAFGINSFGSSPQISRSSSSNLSINSFNIKNKTNEQQNSITNKITIIENVENINSKQLSLTEAKEQINISPKDEGNKKEKIENFEQINDNIKQYTDIGTISTPINSLNLENNIFSINILASNKDTLKKEGVNMAENSLNYKEISNKIVEIVNLFNRNNNKFNNLEEILNLEEESFKELVKTIDSYKNITNTSFIFSKNNFTLKLEKLYYSFQNNKKAGQSLNEVDNDNNNYFTKKSLINGKTFDYNNSFVHENTLDQDHDAITSIINSYNKVNNDNNKSKSKISFGTLAKKQPESNKFKFGTLSSNQENSYIDTLNYLSNLYYLTGTFNLENKDNNDTSKVGFPVAFLLNTRNNKEPNREGIVPTLQKFSKNLVTIINGIEDNNVIETAKNKILSIISPIVIKVPDNKIEKDLEEIIKEYIDGKTFDKNNKNNDDSDDKKRIREENLENKLFGLLDNLFLKEAASIYVNNKKEKEQNFFESFKNNVNKGRKYLQQATLNDSKIQVNNNDLSESLFKNISSLIEIKENDKNFDQTKFEDCCKKLNDIYVSVAPDNKMEDDLKSDPKFDDKQQLYTVSDGIYYAERIRNQFDENNNINKNNNEATIAVKYPKDYSPEYHKLIEKTDNYIEATFEQETININNSKSDIWNQDKIKEIYGDKTTNVEKIIINGVTFIIPTDACDWIEINKLIGRERGILPGIIEYMQKISFLRTGKLNQELVSVISVDGEKTLENETDNSKITAALYKNGLSAIKGSCKGGFLSEDEKLLKITFGDKFNYIQPSDLKNKQENLKNLENSIKNLNKDNKKNIEI